MAAHAGALLQSECPSLKLLHRGKVRDVYEVDEVSLLFVATDRISAFDVIMTTVLERSALVTCSRAR